MIDIHSHILPGIDDGPKDEELFIQMAHIAETDGIKQIIATPHIMPGIFNNNTESIKEQVIYYNNLLKDEAINVELHFGAEHYLDDSFQKMLQQNNICTVNNQGKYILVELPMQEIPVYAEELLFEIQLKGLVPILAHPERNVGIKKNPAFLFDLINRGMLVQINASSILGHFGQTIAQLANTMLQHNWVHFIASDAHSAGVRSPRLSEAVDVVRKIIGDKADDLVYLNPQKLLAGEDIEIGEALSLNDSAKSFLASIKSLFGLSK